MLRRSREAKGGTVERDGVRVEFKSHVRQISFPEIEEVRLKAHGFWGRRSSVSLVHEGGPTTIARLRREEAQSLAEAIETARAAWWQRQMTARAGALDEVVSLLAKLADPPRYVKRKTVRLLKRQARAAAGDLLGRLPPTGADTADARKLRQIGRFLAAPEQARATANTAYVANELRRSRKLFDQVEEQPLTHEQRKAVVTDEANNLIIAGAGSGKTAVMMAKAAWLIERQLCKPGELLLLAFARDARDEVAQRAQKRLATPDAQEMTVRTFHSLGMAIIGAAEQKRPALSATAESDRALLKQLKAILSDLMADATVAKSLIEWFQDNFAPYKSELEFENWGQYWSYIRQNQICSLAGEQVKSYEECEIANFLYLNGIAYRYEAPYEHDTSTSDRRQYKPDFHLIEAKIYIEHFGVDAAGNTAPYIDREEYQAGMQWKRSVHAKHGTTLIETFTHERTEGQLIRNLEKKLTAHGVQRRPVPPEQVFKQLQEQGQVNPFIRLVATFLQHFKGNRLSIEEVGERARNTKEPNRAQAFVRVFEAIAKRYQAGLDQAKEIDFHDMITRATEHIDSGRYRSPFRYILVDEFQDISLGRAQLLKALLQSGANTQLFAVGDDWQAIYRFGGSDIAIMRNFEAEFGDYERIDLEATFRCADEVSTVATDFVLRNPAQIRRAVRSVHSNGGTPSVHVGLAEKQGASVLKEALDRVAENAAKHAGRSTVLMLGRYRNARPPNLRALENDYPTLQLNYMTIHRAKGLEADYAIVLGLRAGRRGFPVEITDDPLLNLVMTAAEPHRNAEERRLLYVALTRARRHVFLLTDGGPPSAFATELMKDTERVNVFGMKPEADVSCIECKEGRLTKRQGKHGGNIFYGCSNYPYCEHTVRACPTCRGGLIVREADGLRCRNCGGTVEGCPACDGWLETRMGRFGRFQGCSNYPRCEYTRNVYDKQRSAHKRRH